MKRTKGDFNYKQVHKNISTLLIHPYTQVHVSDRPKIF